MTSSRSHTTSQRFKNRKALRALAKLAKKTSGKNKLFIPFCPELISIFSTVYNTIKPNEEGKDIFERLELDVDTLYSSLYSAGTIEDIPVLVAVDLKHFKPIKADIKSSAVAAPFILSEKELIQSFKQYIENKQTTLSLASIIYHFQLPAILSGNVLFFPKNKKIKSFFERLTDKLPKIDIIRPEEHESLSYYYLMGNQIGKKEEIPLLYLIHDQNFDAILFNMKKLAQLSIVYKGISKKKPILLPKAQLTIPFQASPPGRSPEQYLFQAGVKKLIDPEIIPEYLGILRAFTLFIENDVNRTLNNQLPLVEQIDLLRKMLIDLFLSKQDRKITQIQTHLSSSHLRQKALVEIIDELKQIQKKLDITLKSKPQLSKVYLDKVITKSVNEIKNYAQKEIKDRKCSFSIEFYKKSLKNKTTRNITVLDMNMIYFYLWQTFLHIVQYDNKDTTTTNLRIKISVQKKGDLVWVLLLSNAKHIPQNRYKNLKETIHLKSSKNEFEIITSILKQHALYQKGPLDKVSIENLIARKYHSTYPRFHLSIPWRIIK